LARDGEFNADFPIAALTPGINTVEVGGRFADRSMARQTMTLERLSGESPLPVQIAWSTVSDPQEVGQYVDGHWRLGGDGLRPAHLGYDQMFLIGNETWQDYQSPPPSRCTMCRGRPARSAAATDWAWCCASLAT
jgi:hypothetical protein